MLHGKQRNTRAQKLELSFSSTRHPKILCKLFQSVSACGTAQSRTKERERAIYEPSMRRAHVSMNPETTKCLLPYLPLITRESPSFDKRERLESCTTDNVIWTVAHLHPPPSRLRDRGGGLVVPWPHREIAWVMCVRLRARLSLAHEPSQLKKDVTDVSPNLLSGRA